MHQAAQSNAILFLLEIILSEMSVDVFLIAESLRNTAVQQNQTKPL